MGFYWGLIDQVFSSEIAADTAGGRPGRLTDVHKIRARTSIEGRSTARSTD